MTAEQNSRFDMWERVLKVCNENLIEVALNPIFQEDKTALEMLLPTVRDVSKRIKLGNSHAETKQKIKDSMIALGLDVCINLNSYGTKMKDEGLKKMSNHSKSSLGSGKEEQVIERNQNIADTARTLLTELTAKRGMKATLLTDYEAAIGQYTDIKTEPRSALQGKSALITELDATMSEGETAFELLKASAVNLKDSAAAFFNRFDTACTLIASRTITTKTSFMVINGETNEKITDYTVDSSALNMNKMTMLAQASPMSTKYHKSADFVISKEGFETAVLNAEQIKKGKNNTIKVTLIPIKATT